VAPRSRRCYPGVLVATPVILHADMDAFYASVEQRDRPELRGRPVIVGGASGRGVVAAASYEARRFGVRSAMPTVRARALCPDAVIVPGDMAKYRRVSAQIRAVFEGVSPAVEPLSLDEAFIDATASVRLLGPPLAIGRLVKDGVRAATGLAVSVGIGPGKMVAKIASDLSKPDGLLEVPPERVREFLRPLPVGRLWGVGPVTEAALRSAGIATVGDLAAADPDRLARRVGAAAGMLHRLALGEDVRDVEPDRGARSYGEESTFAADVRDDGTARAAIIAHGEAVARRLRRDAVRARTVVLKIKLAQRLGPGVYRLLTRQAPLSAPSDDGAAITAAALALWARHRPDGPVRLLGVAATGIVAAADPQLALFDDPRRAARQRLNAALDRIVGRFGAGSIGRAVGRPEKASPTLQVKRGEED
jgi:DNA polymerase-4